MFSHLNALSQGTWNEMEIYQSCQRHSWLLQAIVLSAPPVQAHGPYTPCTLYAIKWGHCTAHPGHYTAHYGCFATHLGHCAIHPGNCATPRTLRNTPRILRNILGTLCNTPGSLRITQDITQHIAQCPKSRSTPFCANVFDTTITDCLKSEILIWNLSLNNNNNENENETTEPVQTLKRPHLTGGA